MSTDFLTPTSELEAVNALLASIGETPVGTLLGVLPVDVAAARALVSLFSRQLQKTGWSFNTEFAYRITPNVNGEIILPLDALKVDSADDTNLVQRGQRLYDPVAHTFAIRRAVTVDLVRGLPFDQLPETARNYVTIAALRRFQDRFLSDAEAHTFSAKDEAQARAEFLSDEADAADYNVLDAATPSRILRRRGRSWQ
ncbi:hypothetical protein [Xanthobacter sp. YC-JY1]|uniref:hypothetical protein n=1 Tax=Xanthobacter sp. YC-JY1 TaxID=2419844 RepID=UPI001F451A43|nr:hypothetical protein [Xanthobacter sp. YC-JY1]UJX45757.1 phage tail protein [Xanthobacter sp. YC-JY1]